MQLNDLHILNLDSIQDELCIVAAAHPMRLLGENMQFLSEAFEARGIFHLLLDFDPAAFATNLQRSGHARRYFLRKSREQSSDDAIYVALSRTDAVFDCIVGGDWRMAVEIRRLSPRDWTPAGGYLEDFCYHNLVHACVEAAITQTDLAEAERWGARLEQVTAEIPHSALDVARLEIGLAFVSGDQDRFWAAFERLVEISGNRAAAVPLADGRVFEFPWLAADRFISIELLAWMALARGRRYQPPQREYARCPSAAWTPGQIAPATDVFLELEAQFHL